MDDLNNTNSNQATPAEPEVTPTNPTNENTEPTTPAGSSEKNTAMAAVSYLGFFVLIPMLTDAKNDPFVKFHIKQGLGLLIVWVIAFIAGMVPIIGWIFSPFILLAVLILLVIGLINALTGKEKKLPLVGSIGDQFKI